MFSVSSRRIYTPFLSNGDSFRPPELSGQRARLTSRTRNKSRRLFIGCGSRNFMIRQSDFLVFRIIASPEYICFIIIYPTKSLLKGLFVFPDLFLKLGGLAPRLLNNLNFLLRQAISLKLRMSDQEATKDRSNIQHRTSNFE